MSEFSPSGGNEGYGICDDVVDVGNDGKVTNILLVGHTVKTSVEKSTQCVFIRVLIRSPVVWMICSKDW